MKTIGFSIGTKKNEKRRAIIPCDLEVIKNKKYIFIESGYGEVWGYSDLDYIKAGVNIASREEVLSKDIICNPKIGDEDNLDYLKEHQTIFGWIHAAQNRVVTDKLLEKKIKVIAWEDMFENGRHIFWRSNEIAGEAAVMQAYQIWGDVPNDTNVAILGRGNTAIGAYNVLSKFGAKINVYNRNTENLLKMNLEKYDVIVNAVLWDIERTDYVIYKEDLKRMKKGSMIIDVSCNNVGAIETIKPTSLDNPSYLVEGIMHYVVDHTPTIYFKYSTRALSEEVVKYIDKLIENKFDNILNNAVILENGNIIDQRINMVQKRK